MYTCVPSEVIQGRSVPAVSMTCCAHAITENVGEAGLGQLMADTPVFDLDCEFSRKMSVVACSRPVEPISTSASPAPKMVLPGCCRAPSITPCAVGADPKGPVQSCVPNEAGSNNHCSETIPMVPSLPIDISGSLLPLVSSRGVVVNVGLA